MGSERDVRPARGRAVIRVFVSSTFRDMRAERDELTKRVFPELRKLCRNRGVVWGDVDLRWGITDEATAEGKVLPICLEEIRRCRPYFIGLLGERYGWRPETIPEELLEAEPWLRERTGRSVTELEILHGALNPTLQTPRAFFYFRDPSYLANLPPRTDPADYAPDSPEAAARLIALKERIRQSGLHVTENYGDPVEFGRFVLKDLSELVKSEFPDETPPDPFELAIFRQESFAASYRDFYLGREEYFEVLDRHANGDGSPLVVLGEPGCGKTALLANWANRWRESHPGMLVLDHYFSAVPGSGYWAEILGRVIEQIRRTLDLKIDIQADVDAMQQALGTVLHAAAEKGPIVLVIDGLDELEDQGGMPDLLWLPREIPPNVRLVLSTLPGRSLDELRKRRRDTLLVEPFTTEERGRYVREYLRSFGRKLADEESRLIATAPQSANPLYLQILLTELRVHGAKETLPARLARYLKASSLDELFAQVLERYEQDFERDRPRLVSDALGAIFAARRGLSEAELLTLLGSGGEPLPAAVWSPLSLALESGLSDHSGLLNFGHEQLRRAVERRYLSGDNSRQIVHARLATFFETFELGVRKVEELPWQLEQAGNWRRLQELLTDPDFFEAAWELSWSDVTSLWVRMEAYSASSAIEAYRPVWDDGRGPEPYAIDVAHLLARLGHLEKAEKLLTHLVEQSRSRGDDRVLSLCLGNLALMVSDRGDPQGALAMFYEVYEIYRRLPPSKDYGTLLGNCAATLMKVGELDRAMRMLEAQEEICRFYDDILGLQRSLSNQARIHHHRGDFDRAMQLHQREERYCREIGDPDELAICLMLQAGILAQCKDFAPALERIEEASRLFRQVGNRGKLQQCLHNKACILVEMEKYEAAVPVLKAQAEICWQLEDSEWLEKCLRLQSFVLGELGDVHGLLELDREEGRVQREWPPEKTFSLPPASLIRAAMVQKEKGMAPFGRLEAPSVADDISVPAPHPKADAGAAAEANIHYRQKLAAWRALPKWKRLFKKKPEPPPGILA